VNTFVTTKELCKKLNLSLSTLARYRESGMPFIKLTRTTVRYDLEAVMEWLEVRHKEQTGAGLE
jgi:excisionase family DNA binding protein